MDKVTLQNIGEVIGRNTGSVLTPELVLGLTQTVARLVLDAVPPPPPPPEPDYLYPQVAPLETNLGYYFHAFRMDDRITELKELHAQHWNETEEYRHGAEMIPDYGAFRRDEAAGRLVFFGVDEPGGKLIGNCAMYVMPSRHTGERIATEDTLFISKEHRKPGLAKNFIAWMERELAALGVKEVRVDSKTVNHVDKFMKLCGYKEVSTRLMKRLDGGADVR